MKQLLTRVLPARSAVVHLRCLLSWADFLERIARGTRTLSDRKTQRGRRGSWLVRRRNENEVAQVAVDVPGPPIWSAAYLIESRSPCLLSRRKHPSRLRDNLRDSSSWLMTPFAFDCGTFSRVVFLFGLSLLRFFYFL